MKAVANAVSREGAHAGHAHGPDDGHDHDGPDGMDGHVDPRQLMAQREIVQRELDRMERRMAAIEEAMLDAQRAAATVRGLQEAGQQPGRPATHDVFLPVGSGVHVEARVDVNAKVLLPIGAGYLTEGLPDEVLAALEKRIEAITRSFEQAASEAEQLANAAAAMDERLGQMSGQ